MQYWKECRNFTWVVIPFSPANQFSQDVWPEDGIAIIPRNQPREEKFVCVTKKGLSAVTESHDWSELVSICYKTRLKVWKLKKLGAVRKVTIISEQGIAPVFMTTGSNIQGMGGISSLIFFTYITISTITSLCSEFVTNFVKSKDVNHTI